VFGPALLRITKKNFGFVLPLYRLFKRVDFKQGLTVCKVVYILNTKCCLISNSKPQSPMLPETSAQNHNALIKTFFYWQMSGDIKEVVEGRWGYD
jgi:hypothetical protein